MFPTVALVDPELTVTCSPQVTAHSGMDAITQLIESYVTKKVNPVTRALCLEGLKQASWALPVAVKDPTSRPARESMSHATLLSGIALANSGLGLAHGVAAALGVHCQVPHGLACAVMLPAAMQVNLSSRLLDLATIGRVLLNHQTLSSDSEAAQAALNFVSELSVQLGIPTKLRELGVRRDQLPALVKDSRGNSMSNNPTELNDTALAQLLEELW